MFHQNASSRFGRRALPVLLTVGATAVLSAAGISSAAAAPQFGLYNTGIDTGIMMGVDGHYTVKPVAASTAAVTYVTDTTGLPFNPPDDALSAFVSPQPSYAAGQIDAGGEYLFTTTFTLAPSDLTTASIFGRFESDDRIDDVILNGQSLGISLADPDYLAFSQYFNLVANRSLLVAGTNTLSFQLFNFTNNDKDPVALRAEFTNAVPEPSVWAAVVSMVSISCLGGSGCAVAGTRRFETFSNKTRLFRL